jgi:trehalose 6-phosphate synthase
MKQRVLVASNRGPVSYVWAEDGSLAGRRGGGGMIAGVLSGLATVAPGAEVTWICAALSDADRTVARQQADNGATSASPGHHDGVPVRMLDIPADTFDRAYNNVANSALWFVHHMLFDTPNEPRFGLDFARDWAAYRDVNETFASALADEACRGQGPAGGLQVLVQDYHLTLVPRLLRERLGEAAATARIGYFCHTPWAPPDYYRLLPGEVARAVLDGILAADRAGFHSWRWAEAFLDCCAVMLGASVERFGAGGRVRHRGHVTDVAVHPLGVDAPALRDRAAAQDVRAHMGTLTKAAGGRKLIIRVDRTELSKNIVRGLAAYRELLATRPQWHGRVVHLAFAYPSRSALPEYRAYTDRVRALAAEITAEFGTADWNPLILEVKDDYPRSLAACAVADVLVVNPIRDGMNLVAQEGPVLSERGCALVLSREAGAAATLGEDALLINPFDVTETAEALHQALAMTDAERQRRSAALAATAAASPPGRWLEDQLAALQP